MRIDDVTVSNPDPASRISAIRDFLGSMRFRDLELEPHKAHLDSASIYFLNPNITPTGSHPTASKRSLLSAKCPCRLTPPRHDQYWGASRTIVVSSQTFLNLFDHYGDDI